MHESAYPLITPENDFKSDPDLTGIIDFLSVSIMKIATLVKDNFHYLLAAVVLNPVLFLHGLNALFTATRSTMDKPNMLSSFVEPHIDINNNCVHAVIFIIFITSAQLKACQRCFTISSKENIVTEEASSSDTDGDTDSYWQEDAS